MRVQAGLVFGSVGTQRTVKLRFDATFVLEVSREARMIVVDLAAVLAGIRDSLTVQEAQHP